MAKGPFILFLLSFLLWKFTNGADLASFYGNSFIHIPFKEAKSTTELQFKFRTLLPNALILLVAGTTDFCIVRIERGRLKVNINLGAGESELISPPDLLLNDLKWHNVSIHRKDANLLLIVDNEEKIQKNLPGRFFELNIHFGLFIGGHGNFSEIFFGHLEKFRGCISDLNYNGMHAIEEAHHRHVNAIVESVTWNCAAEFESDRNRPISFVKDNSFMYLSHNVQHKEVKIQFDIKTTTGQGVLFYNTGHLSKPDYFVIYLWNDELQVVIKNDDKIVEIGNNFNVTDGEWHKISFHQTQKLLELSVDEKINNVENNGGIFSLNENSFVGGLEMIKLSRAMSNGCKYCDLHFKGCLRNLFIAHKQNGIPDAHVTRGLIPGCVWKYPCKQNPCTETSSCIQHGIDSFKCECNDKFCIKQNYTDTYRVYSQNNLATELELLSVKPLKVMEGGNAVITTENLHMILDYQKYGIQDSGVMFHIIEGPIHGTINVWPQDSNRFTLNEIANDKVHYIHDGLENFQDNIVIELVFKPVESFIPPSYLQGNFMFSMAINVISVNDPPKLGVKNGTVLRVVQGSKTIVSNEILNAEDPDSPTGKLIYSISKNEIGYFENKLKPGVEISTFSQEDVNKENIYFVSKMNDSNNSFISLQISDGLETSKPYRLRVTVSPQYWRLQNNTGLTLLHQNFGLITPFNLSFLSNVANSDYRAQFRVTKKPNYGVVEAEVTANQWKAVDVFSTNDLKQHRVRYRHVTGKPDIDEFQFQTTFDKSSLYTFRINFVRCSLFEINTKPIFMNETQEMIITKQYLAFETKPIRTISTSIKYVITKPPKYGILSSSVSKYTLRTCDTFTQEDIYSMNLKYKLFHKSYSYVQDTFSFIVFSPGCSNITGNMTVIFYPSLDTKSKVMAILHPLSLDEGGQKIIDRDHFNFKTDFLKNITFNVTQGPSHGYLQLIRNDFSINNTKSFTLYDVEEKRLSYIHDDSETDRDVFKFLALSPDDDFQFVGEYNINIIMKNDNSPIRKVDKIFHVVVNGEKLLTGDDLLFMDNDIATSPSKIIYSCHEIENGHFYNLNNLNQRIKEFSQEDLNDKRILFKHQGPENGKIKLWVTDGQFHIDTTLEIQASAPFIKIIMKKKLIVEYGKSAIITNQHLNYFTNLNAGDSDLVYEIISKPSFGKIVTTNNHKKALSTFTQKDINKGFISYINDQSSANGDEISLRAKCKDAVSVAQMGVWMLPKNYWEPFKDRGTKKLQIEEATSALITRKILEISQTNVPPLSITYYVSGIPLNGYLTILSNTNDTDKDIINVFSFTQDLINEKRVLYIQSGANETSDRILFNVTNGIIWNDNVELNIEIIPERLYLGSKSILVEEGGTTVITHANLYVLTNYYKKKITEYAILKYPLYGCIQIHRRCSKLDGFSQKELLAGVVRYAHDGSENSTDEIEIVAIAGQKRSTPVTLRINVTPINDNEPELVNNTGLTMWEGGNAIITNNMLAFKDADIPKDDIKYQILGSWWGNVVLMSDVYTPITHFTQDLIDNKMIGFHHENGTEAKFKFNITDGIHKTQDFYFMIKTKPVRITMRTKPLHIFPLQRKYLTNSHMIACVSDNNRTVHYEVIIPPSLGRLMMESNNPGIFKVVSSFTQDDINNTRIFYEHTHQFSDLYANDSFVFNVKSHLAKSLTKKILKIDISVSSGGLDSYINIPKITVDEGGVTNIALNLSGVMEFLENHSGLRSPIIHISASSPQFGQLLLKNQDNFTATNVFTQQQFENGLIYYHHDHSDSIGDNIHLSLYLIPHYITLCNITIPIIINPVNDQPFHLITPTPSLTVVQGENFTITKNDLETEDSDTPPSKLKYIVISGPYQGKLILSPENNPITHFSQDDINRNKLIYVHNTSVLVDSFHFRVWDDKFRPQFSVFNINILPINLTISPGLPLFIQQGADTVFLTEKQFFIRTNADRNKLKYYVKKEPKYGILYVKNSPSNQFTQIDLENENVMYIQTEMTTANDSFGVVGEIISSNTSFSSEIDVNIKVQPLMQMKNFTAIIGEYNQLTIFVLDASPLAKLTNSNPRYTILNVPKYGKIKRVIRNSGDKRKVLDSVIQSFTHEEIQSGLIYLQVDDIEFNSFASSGYEDKLVFMLAGNIYQPAVGELRIILKYSSTSSNNVLQSTLPGPNDPEGHEGGFHVAGPDMTRDYYLIVTMATGVVLLGVAVIIIIKCRTFEPLNLKEGQCVQPMPLPRPPDRLMSSSPTLKHHDIEDYSQQIPSLPQCKITPLSGIELESQAGYPYGVDDQQEEWSSCENSDPPCSNKNIMLRRNQYWV